MFHRHYTTMSAIVAGTLLTLAARGAAEVRLQDQAWNFGIVKSGTSQVRNIDLLNEGGRDVTLLSATADCTACTKVSVTPTVIPAHGKISVPITFAPPVGDDGAVDHKVLFKISEKNNKQLILKFHAMVAAVAAIDPETVGLTSALPGSDFTQEFLLVNVSKDALTPLYAIGPVEGPKLTLGHGAIAGGTSGKIGVTWHLPSKEGIIRGRLTLFVNHPTLDKISVPYEIKVDSHAQASTTQPAAVGSAPINTPATRGSESKIATDASTVPIPMQVMQPNQAIQSPPHQSIAAVAPPSTLNALTREAAADTQAGHVEMVDLQLKGGLTLKDLVEIVAEQLNLNMIYDEQQLNVPITVHLTGPIPQDAILPMLKTVLQSKGFAIVATDRKDIWRIVTSREAQVMAEPANHDEMQQIVTEFIKPESVDLETAAGLLRGFVTSGVGQITTVPSAKVLIVTDYANQLAKLHRLMDLVDKPQAVASVQVISLKEAEAVPLVERLNKLIDQISRSEGRSGFDHVFVSAGDDGQSVVLVGPTSQLDRVTSLVKQFDVAPTVIRTDYPIADSQRTTAVETIRQVWGKQANDLARDGLPRVLVTPQRVSVAATEGQQQRIKEFLGLNNGSAKSGVILKAYRINNRDAAEIGATITRLLGDMKSGGLNLDTITSKYTSGVATAGGVNGINENGGPGASDGFNTNGLHSVSNVPSFNQGSSDQDASKRNTPSQNPLLAPPPLPPRAPSVGRWVRMRSISRLTRGPIPF